MLFLPLAFVSFTTAVDLRVLERAMLFRGVFSSGADLEASIPPAALPHVYAAAAPLPRQRHRSQPTTLPCFVVWRPL